MLRPILLVTIICAIVLLSACQLDAETNRPVRLARQSDTATPGPTRTPARTAATPIAAATATPTLTSSPTQTPTPTITPTPTDTPEPSRRLATAQQAYTSGDYATARLEFDGLLTAPGASPDEKRLALHWRGRSELELGDQADAIATFESFLRQYPDDTLARSAQFNLGRAYEQSGLSDTAASAYAASIVPSDPVNVYIYQRIGDIGLRTGIYTDTVAAYQAGIEATEDTGFQAQFREKIAEAELLLNENPDAAIAQYETILDIATIDSERARILRLVGEAYLAMADTESAYEKYLEAVNRYPEAYDSYLALVELVNADVPVDEFQRGLVDYHAEAYVPAIAAFERYLAQQAPSEANVAAADDPTGPFRPPITSTRQLTTTVIVSSPTPPNEPADLMHAAEATWLMALSTKAIGQYSGANLIFQNLIDSFPQSPNWGEAHLEIGKTYIVLGNSGRAKTFLREFAQRNPNDPLADEALWRAAQLELSDDLFEEASVSLRQLADDYPTSEYAVDALYWAGQSAYTLEDYEQAIDIWTELTDNYPTSDLASYGSYWNARALTELDQEEEALAVLTQVSESPLDYYVLRARDLLAGRQPASIPLKIPTKSELAVEQAQAEAWLRQWLDLDRNRTLSLDRSDLQSDQAFLRGDTLLELGLRDEALVEFETVKDTWWNDALAMYQLSDYFKDRQLGRLSILTAARLISLSPVESPEEAPVYIQRLHYPIYFEDLIFGEAASLDLDPALLIALIRQESLFEQSAHSHAGARGLTQVMPGTGEYVAERSGAEDFNVDKLWLPYISIRFGSWYISQQLGIFEGNQFAALAAYNAGPGNVLEWIKTSDDLDVFVESIPFWESRVYIRTIYVNLAAYRSLYGVPPADESSEQNSPLSDE